MTTAQSVTTHPLIGAIRWDAWFDPSNGVVAQAVETDLAPTQFLDRGPAFTTVNANGSLSINGDSQAEMNSEIQLAASAGIDYWAFDYYGASDPMNNALQLYLQSPIHNLVNFALIDAAGWGATLSNYQAAMQQRAALMAQPTYQTVEGNRTLYYVMAPSAQIVNQWWGGDPANMKAAIDALRADVIAQTGANPYIVVMGSPAQAASFAQEIGADGISAYAITGGDQNGSFQTLTNKTEAGWNAELGTGQSVIPTVMTGWDPSPRRLNPVPWGADGTSTYTKATPQQIAAQLSDALAWIMSHPDSTAGTALVYAWNEFDEGGWLAPTYVADNPQGDMSRLDALAAVNALYQGATAAQNADGSTTITLGDGSSYVFHPDHSVSKYNSAGLLTETDHADGSSITYASDGTATWLSVTGTVTRVVFADGSDKIPWSDGWLWFNAQGHYVQHEVDLPDGGERIYNSAGKLAEIINANGTKSIYGSDGARTDYAASGAVTKIVAADGSSKRAWSDGWLYFNSHGQYVQHEVDLTGGGEQLYNAAGHLTKIIAADGSSKVAWSDGWLWFSAKGSYLQHEVDLPGGVMQFYNAAGHLTEIIQSGVPEFIIGPATTSEALAGLASDPSWKLDLIGGVGGFASVAAVMAAFQPDGQGGSVLNLPGGVHVDLVGVAPSSLTLAHFVIS